MFPQKTGFLNENLIVRYETLPYEIQVRKNPEVPPNNISYHYCSWLSTIAKS